MKTYLKIMNAWMSFSIIIGIAILFLIKTYDYTNYHDCAIIILICAVVKFIINIILIIIEDKNE